MYKFLAIFVLISKANSDIEETFYLPYEPQQVHISFGESANNIVVTWNTLEDTTDSFVEFGIDELEQTQKSKEQAFKFVDSGELNLTQYIHRVTIPYLKYNTTYIYRCGTDKAWSQKFHFHTPQADGKGWLLSMAIYGDFGLERGLIYPLLLHDTEKHMYDAIAHIGDIAYDMHEENGTKGDEFMRKMEPIAGSVPYMTCAGNHEEAYNFSHYRARFSMPGHTENLFYSFNLGPVHFIVLHTEVYYFFNIYYQLSHVIYQYNWLEHDLHEATKPENRAKRPWIITLGHRPMYCSSRNDDDCTPGFVSAVRKGIPFGNYGLEALFYRYGVDIEMWAHEHSYERMWPVYDGKVFNGSFEEPYRNPRAPVHLITGAAGNRERFEYFIKPSPVWSAFQAREKCFTRIKVHNDSHLYMEQVTHENEILDSFWIIKDWHGAYV